MTKNNKNTGKNAFYLFMLDWKKQEERQGRIFQGGMDGIRQDPAVHDAWRNLTPEKKAHYKELEKKSKLQVTVEKKTSTGELMVDVEKRITERQNFIENMKKYIHDMVYTAEANNTLPDLKFYVIHINFSYSRHIDQNEIEYFPVEVGLAEFSLKEGVSSTYEVLVNSEILKGYASAVRDHCRSTHQIPADTDAYKKISEGDFKEIYNEIYQFLKPGMKNGKLPPLYTIFYNEVVRYSIVNCLQKFADAAGDSAENFEVYSFEELFVNIHNVKESVYENLSDVIVKRKIETNPYAFKINICCDYHQQSGAGCDYCSRSFVHRWISVLCVNCCDLYDIELVKGHHVPKDELNEQSSEKITNDFGQLSIGFPSQRSRPPRSFAVAQEKHTSERTYKDEQRRKAESKPLTIHYHGSEQPPFPASSEVRHVLEPQPSEQNKTGASQKPAVGQAKSSWSNKLFNSSKPSEPSSSLDFPKLAQNSVVHPQASQSSQELAAKPWSRAPRVDDFDNIALDNDNFPAFGRGRGNSQKRREIKDKFGSSNSSYASRLK